MRFFKSFKLLHRRTKSEPSNSFVSGISNLQPTAQSTSNLPSVFSTIAPDVLPMRHPNIRILDLESENIRLRNLSSNAIEGLATVKSQLTATQADLFAELHRSARRHQDAQREIQGLYETLAQYEGFIIHVASSPHLPVGLDLGRFLDQVLSNAMERGNRSLVINSPNMSTAFGIRSLDDYKSAIQLTLKSRLQLRQCRKIAKFWKKTVQTELGIEALVTPSASTISSIVEVPPDRQKAVDELIARRSANKAYLVSTPVDTLQQPNVILTLTQAPPPRSFEALSPVGAIHATKFSPKVDILSPSRSLPQGRPYLSPLASQSLRQELDRFAPGSRLTHWPHISRKLLDQLDLNVCNYNTQERKPIRLSHNSTVRNRQQATQGRSNSISRKAVTQTSLQSVDNDIGTGPVAQGLGDIREETKFPSNLSLSSNGTSRWVECHIKDMSFGSDTVTLIPPTPTTPAAENSLRRTKSKIPLPVFKTLRRLSSTRFGRTKQTKDAVLTPLGKQTAEVSFTRLPRLR